MGDPVNTDVVSQAFCELRKVNSPHIWGHFPFFSYLVLTLVAGLKLTEMYQTFGIPFIFILSSDKLSKILML